MVRSEDGGGLELLDAVLDLLRRVHLAPVQLSVGGDEHELLALVELAVVMAHGLHGAHLDAVVAVTKRVLTLVKLLGLSEVLIEGGQAGNGVVGGELGVHQHLVLTR